MFQGEERRKNHDFVDRLRLIAQAAGHSVAELVINWTIHQPGITGALCGAKRPIRSASRPAPAVGGLRQTKWHRSKKP